MIGTELVTMAVSAAFSSFMSLWKQGREDAHERLMASIRMDEINAKAIAESNSMARGSRAFSLTRNILALGIVASYIATKWYAAVNSIPVYIAEDYTKGGFSFFGIEIIKQQIGTRLIPVNGFVILPIDYHLIFAVIGLYFGYVATRKGR